MLWGAPRTRPALSSQYRTAAQQGFAGLLILGDVKEVHPLLSGFPVVTTIPLLWGDEDAFGHVNNLAYLRWCESSRVEYLQRVGLWTDLPPSGAGPILASVTCDYKAQLKYPDTVQVGTRVSRIGNTSFRMEHRIVSRSAQEVAALVDSTLVLLDYRLGKPVPIPLDIRRTIGELEGRIFENARAEAAAV